ncbi:MAG: efflux RND transporter permease subunit [Phycisphaerales bacterium]
MDIIRWSMNRPVSVTVAVLLVVIFGLIGLGAIPIQLTPTVDRPVVTVSTAWPGRSPEEVVDAITKEQEKRLKNVANLKSMRSMTREGGADITLEFYLGADISRALQEVSDALRQVPNYPEEVDEPTIRATEGATENAVAWIIIDLDPEWRARHPGYDISTLFDPLDREVRPYIERIDGVAEVNVYGGRNPEVRVLVDPVALAQRGLTHEEVVGALRAENRNVSGGTIAEGKRDYRVRVIGQFGGPEDVLAAIVAYRDGRPVYVRDIGTADIGYEKERGFVRALGEPCLAMNIKRQSGSNVMKIMAQVRERLEVVRKEMLPRLDPVVGPGLRMRQVYDETNYIRSSIDLVLTDLRVGGALAVIVLLVFLRSVRITLLIALAIPISVIGTFLIMLAAGRTLNVVSLAGLAFSTGVVVDNAIVVLENIDRRRRLGDRPLASVYNGAREVWGAILAGSLCHVAVFLPILTVPDESGQLFFDLTMALSVSILLSLLVAITVVPSGAAILMRLTKDRGAEAERERRAQRGRVSRAVASAFGLAPLFARLTRGLSGGLYWLMTGWRGWTLRPALIVTMVGASILGARALAPPMDYLPAGNQNLVFGILLIPPGLSMAQQHDYAEKIEAKVSPYLRADLKRPETVAALPPIMRFDAFDASGRPKVFDPVPLENFFIGSFNGGLFVGGTSQDPQRVIPVGTLLTQSMNGMPDAFGFAGQASIFGQGLGGGNRINMEISGPDLARVRAAAGFAMGKLMADPRYGPFSTRPDPQNFNMSQQEWRIKVNRAGRELGLRPADLGVAIRGLFDGAFIDDFQLQGRAVDFKLYPKDGRLVNKEQLADIPIATPDGRVVPLASVVDIEPGLAPQEIQRIEELQSVTMQISPPKDQPLQAVMDDLTERVIEPAKAMGIIDPSMLVRLEGSAAKLTQVRESLVGSPPPPDRKMSGWQKGLMGLSWAVVLAGAIVGLIALTRGVSRGRGDLVYGAVGALLLGVIVGGILLGIAWRPDLLMARMVWTVMVTYLLMCALFESFLYPFVIMFTVPLGLVGAFAGLYLVHRWTLAQETIAPQQMDVLTMLGFVILIGTVVNNAILIVEQARHFMGQLRLPGDEGKEPLEPKLAIAESVRTRVRPIFMTTFTTLGGGLPLVIAPGAGSEMYRGLGAVVCGGLLVSTLFTLVLVPLVFSLVMEMAAGVRAFFGYPAGPGEAQREVVLAPSAESRELEPV